MAGDTSPEAPRTTYKTSDLSIAAYLHLKRHTTEVRLRKAERSGSGRFLFRFVDPDLVVQGLLIEYANSEAAAFDQSVRTLKKMVMNGSGKQ